MPTSALLIRWNGGWHEYILLAAEAEFGRSEAFLSLGAVQSVPEARRLARAELENQFARVREQITAEHRPDSLAEMPYVAYKPGDSKITAPGFDGDIDEYEVVSMTVTEDDDGVLTFVPTIGDNMLDVEWFQQEAVHRPSTGAKPPGGQANTSGDR